jgi:hypothetical protein
MPGDLPNRKIKAIDLMQSLMRLPDELRNGEGLLHGAGSSGHQTARIARIQTTSSGGVSSQPLPGGRLRYAHRLTLAPAQTLN